MSLFDLNKYLCLSQFFYKTFYSYVHNDKIKNLIKSTPCTILNAYKLRIFCIFSAPIRGGFPYQFFVPSQSASGSFTLSGYSILLIFIALIKICLSPPRSSELFYLWPYSQQTSVAIMFWRLRSFPTLSGYRLWLQLLLFTTDALRSEKTYFWGECLFSELDFTLYVTLSHLRSFIILFPKWEKCCTFTVWLQPKPNIHMMS